MIDSKILSVSLSLGRCDPLPKDFQCKFLSLLNKELQGLQYATSQINGDSCLKHSLCAKLKGYRLEYIATADSLEEAEELLFKKCVFVIEHLAKDEF